MDTVKRSEDRAAAAEEDVGGLEVAVEEALGVQALEPGGHVDEQRQEVRGEGRERVRLPVRQQILLSWAAGGQAGGTAACTADCMFVHNRDIWTSSVRSASSRSKAK